MPITVFSPYSGRPVKVRDQDVSRAIRDEEGRIFYVVPKSDGNGHYTSPTRKGSEKDEQRYAELQAKQSASAERVKEQHKVAFDATGPGRKRPWTYYVLVLLFLLGGAVGGWFAVDYFLDEEIIGLPDNPLENVLPNEVPGVPEAPDPIDLPQPQASASSVESRSFFVQRIAAEAWEQMNGGVQWRVEQQGEGPAAFDGAYAVVRLFDGVQPPVNLDAWHTRRFVVGGFPAHRDLPLVNNTVRGMRPGERRLLVVPGSASDPTPIIRRVELVELLPGISRQTLREATHAEGDPAEVGDTLELALLVTAVAEPMLRLPANAQAPLPGTRLLDTADGQAMRLTLGERSVVEGIELGLVGMRVGERRRLLVPPYLAYGDRGVGEVVPPGATLLVDAELLQIINRATPRRHPAKPARTTRCLPRRQR